MSNNRKHPRLPLPMTVEVSIDKQGIAMTKTRDMSDGGVFLEKTDELDFEMGTKLTIKVVENMQGEQANEIPATVVRVAEDGVAVMFDL